MMGKRKNLPKAMTKPDTAKTQKVMALVQCALRSNGVKRSILRPVVCPCKAMVPRRQ